MGWSTPRTWNPGETVTASLMNAHIRDQLNVLKTKIDDQGILLTELAAFAFSSGQGNAAGGADTQLTSYNVTIPAGFLAQPGDALIIEGAFVTAANANTKTGKLQVDSATLMTILSTTGSSHVVPFRLALRRRTSTGGSLTGITWQGAADAGNPTPRLTNANPGTLAWGSAQTLKIFAAGTAANDLRLTDYMVSYTRVPTGVTV